jgi:hypothetical protein
MRFGPKRKPLWAGFGMKDDVLERKGVDEKVISRLIPAGCLCILRALY